MKAYGITLLRVTVGAIYLLHAYRLVAVTTPTATATFIAQTFGLPYPTLMAWLVIAAHGLGGLMLVGGILTRGAAAANALITAVILVRVHVPHGFFLRGPGVELGADRSGVVGVEYMLLLTAATLALLFLGSGPLALRPSK
ncbi:MAG TPA: DoxX family membrane protein [Methylomirabilota bacterium]|jgi:putative oxidoreductase|nr:DoxX family membrane protein [Methylomirabilota bacterium]